MMMGLFFFSLVSDKQQIMVCGLRECAVFSAPGNAMLEIETPETFRSSSSDRHRGPESQSAADRTDRQTRRLGRLGSVKLRLVRDGTFRLNGSSDRR